MNSAIRDRALSPDPSSRNSPPWPLPVEASDKLFSDSSRSAASSSQGPQRLARVEPELLRWFRDEAHLPLGQAVNEGLRQLQHNLQATRLQERIDRELREGEALVHPEELEAWSGDAC